MYDKDVTEDFVNLGLIGAGGIGKVWKGKEISTGAEAS